MSQSYVKSIMNVITMNKFSYRFMKKIDIFLMLEDPKTFWRQKFQNFWKKMSEVAVLGLGKYQKEQSHEFWWT